MNSVRRLAPPLVASLFCWGIVAAFYLAVVHRTHGVFAYPLDDTYIHLVMARSLSNFGVWGVSAAGFSSASSSPGWTLLLAGSNLLFGVHVFTPLWLNLIFAAGLLFMADYGLRYFVPDITLQSRMLSLLAFVLLVPLPNLVFISMEHVLHTLAIFMVVIFGIQVLALAPGVPVRRSPAALLLLGAFLAGAARYESVFTIALLGLLLLWRGRIVLALLVGIASALVIAGFGIYSHHISGLWLSYSVIMKQAWPHRTGLARLLELNSKGHVYTFSLLALALAWALRRKTRGFWDASQLLILFSFAIMAMHILYAPVGWLMRYEGYFMALFVLALLVLWGLRPKPFAPRTLFAGMPAGDRAMTVLLAISLLALVPYNALRLTRESFLSPERSGADRYFEHLQMAGFTKQFYDHNTLVLNDIGAVAYFSDARLLDLNGLASIEPVRAVQSGHPMTADDVRAWAAREGAPIAILQEGWSLISDITPKQWIHVADWQPPQLALKNHAISFYATTSAEVPRLCRSLEEYRLPPEDRLVFAPAVCAGR